MNAQHTFDRRRLLVGATAAATAATLVGLTPAQAVPVAPEVTKFDFPDSGDLRVLVTGDAGTGTHTQWAVAEAMREFHRREPVSFALGLGDNIYERGPISATDSQFTDKFENPNAGLDFPWVMALGNHDTTGIFPGDGAWLLAGNHEVEYHARSPRWWMPSRYYSVRTPGPAPVAEFFVLDLNPLTAYIPPLLSPYWAVDGQYMSEQRAWLATAIAESPATWKIACTHHPYVSNGSHGDAGRYEGLPIEPMNGIHAKHFFEDLVVGHCHYILSGHDHSLQVLEPTAASKGTRQIVSGAAAKTAANKSTGSGGGGHAALFESFHRLGFMVMDFRADAVHLRVFTVDPSTAIAEEAFQRRLH